MNKITLYFALIFIFSTSIFKTSAQDMDNEALGKLIHVVADSVQGREGNWQFLIKDRILVCVTDQNNNRMRIMSPIIEQKKLAYTDMLKLMEANFHTALDVKYAISNDLLWSVFIHPLKELDKKEAISAIEQVYAAASTYGTTYNSTGLTFPNRREEEIQEKKKKKL